MCPIFGHSCRYFDDWVVAILVTMWFFRLWFFLAKMVDKLLCQMLVSEGIKRKYEIGVKIRWFLEMVIKLVTTFLSPFWWHSFWSPIWNSDWSGTVSNQVIPATKISRRSRNWKHHFENYFLDFLRILWNINYTYVRNCSKNH